MSPLRRLALTLACTAALAPAALAADPPKMTPEQQAAMEAWQKAATPGPQHKLLAAMAGRWNMAVTSWDDPSKPETSSGTATFTVMFGGRFVREDVKGTMMGQAYEGFGLNGYDNLKQRYFAYWMDSMGTAPLLLWGDASPDGKVTTYTGEMTDPMSGKPMKLRSVSRIESADRAVFTMYAGMPDGSEMKMMEIVYTRAK